MMLNELTKEEQDALKDATLKDWIEAIHELINEPQFWKDVAKSFFQGLTR